MLSLTGLIELAFPTRTVRLCDGGFFTAFGQTFRGEDEVFGSLGSIEPLSEGLGDEVPALELVLHPPGTTPAASLSQPGFQRARVRCWTALYDPASGLIQGSPDLAFDGQVDQTTLSIGRGSRALAITVVSLAERLFGRNIGNTLSPAFHKTLWPGELGHDNAIGLTVPVAWGVAAPVRAAGGGGSGGGGFDGGGGGDFGPELNFR